MSRIKTISINEYFKLMEYFRKNLVVGVELERPISMNISILSSHLKTKGTTHSNRDDMLSEYKKATTNEYNVAFVYPDSSLNDGVEIVFNGTAENFDWVYNKLLKLETKLDKLGCRNYCSSTSNHITMVSLQDKLLNPIILVNLYNVTKAFSPAIYWLCSGDTKENVVRSGIKNYAPLTYINPIGKAFENLKDDIGRGFLNFSKQNTITISDEEVLSGIMVEFRCPDGQRVPSALTSIMFLFKAMMFKALELSTKGIVMTESLIDDWSMVKLINANINSQNMSRQDKEFCQDNAKELIEFLLPQLKMLAPESIPILKSLADVPVSQRSKRKWSEVEKELSNKMKKTLTENEEKLVAIVINKEITEDNAGLWRKKVAKKIGRSTRMIEYMMKGIETKVSMRFVFDNEIKQYRLE